jgi:hypothetical protein
MPFGELAEKRRQITATEFGAILSGIDLSCEAPEGILARHLRNHVNSGFSRTKG